MTIIIPVGEETAVTTFGPVTLPVSGRPVALQVLVSAPATGVRLPVILLSHGHGRSNFLSSLRGYRPLADFWAAHGFVVIQPTHLDSKTLDLDPTGPEGPLFWRSRAEDLRVVLDRLDEIEHTVPGLLGRLDPTRVVVAGHSLGGHTAAMLLGMRVTDPVSGATVDLRDERVTAGALLAAPGRGDDLAAFAAEHYPVLRHLDFTTMTAPALVVVGDHDVNPAFSARAYYRADAFHASPGPKTLLTVYGAEHGLGGVSGYDVAETTDEDPGRVAALRALIWAYFRSAVDPGDPAWADACATLEGSADPQGRVETK